MLFVILFAILYLPISILYPTWVIHKNRLPRKKKLIATSNHYSNLDALIYNFRFFRKFRFLAKQELFKNKFLSWFFHGIAAVPVDRKQITPSMYKNIMGELNKGRQLFIFPEGTRNKEGTEEMGDTKSGVITFASKGDVEIYPMLMWRMPKLFRKNYIIVGEPFKVVGENPKRLTPEEVQNNLDIYAQKMVDLRKELDDFLASKKKGKKKTKETK